MKRSETLRRQMGTAAVSVKRFLDSCVFARLLVAPGALLQGLSGTDQDFGPTVGIS